MPGPAPLLLDCAGVDRGVNAPRRWLSGVALAVDEVANIAAMAANGTKMRNNMIPSCGSKMFFKAEQLPAENWQRHRSPRDDRRIEGQTWV